MNKWNDSPLIKQIKKKIEDLKEQKDDLENAMKSIRNNLKKSTSVNPESDTSMTCQEQSLLDQKSKLYLQISINTKVPIPLVWKPLQKWTAYTAERAARAGAADPYSLGRRQVFA